MVDLELYALSVLCKDYDAEAYEESKELYLEAMRYREIAKYAQTTWGGEAADRQGAELFRESERVFWKAGLNKICTWHDMCRFWHDHK